MVLTVCPLTGKISSSSSSSKPAPSAPRSATVKKEVGFKHSRATDNRSYDQEVEAAVGRRRALLKRRCDDEPGFLGRAQVSLPTLRRYRRLVSDFCSWAGLPSIDRFGVSDEQTLGSIAVDYLEEMFRGGTGKGGAIAFVAGLVHLAKWGRRYQHRLPKTTSALRAWGRLELDRSRDPFPWLLVQLLAFHVVQQGTKAALEAGRAIVIQFALLLRPNELIAAKTHACFVGHARSGKCHIAVRSGRGPQRAFVDLSGAPIRPSKTQDFDDTVKFDRAMIDNKVCAVFDRQVADALAAGSSRLFPSLSQGQYVRFVAEVARACIPFAVTPHEFRHGGASEDVHRELHSLPERQLRGRWRAFDSVRRFQKAGRLLSVIRRVGDAAVLEARRVESLRLQFLL